MPAAIRPATNPSQSNAPPASPAGAGGVAGSRTCAGRKSGEQDRPARLEQRLLQHALQLADVARPRVRPQCRQRLRRRPPRPACPAPGRTAGRSARPAAARSSPRSRSGGRRMVNTFSRKYRSRRNRPSSAIFSRSALVAAISRTSVWIVSLPPTRSNRCSWSSRRIFAWVSGGHVADLVEEERAAVALLELADPLAVGPGERALLVAEQLALQQALRDGRAVDRQERLVGPLAVLVDGPGDQLLAGAALAEDQHRHVLRGDPADRLVHLLHRRAAADQQRRPPAAAGVDLRHRRPARASAGWTRTARSTSSRSSASSSGLSRYSNAPSFIASMAGSVVPCPVMRMTGMRASIGADAVERRPARSRPAGGRRGRPRPGRSRVDRLDGLGGGGRRRAGPARRRGTPAGRRAGWPARRRRPAAWAWRGYAGSGRAYNGAYSSRSTRSPSWPR